ncbi:MAG: hypothetical protein ACP5G6_08355 [Conexivisphaera sp.]
MRRGPGIPHLDAFLLALSRHGYFMVPETLNDMVAIGYNVYHYERAHALLARHGYLISAGRGLYIVNPELYYMDPAGRIRVNPPERPREPRLDLLLIVLSGDRTPREAFTHLHAGAQDPRALYMRARRELLKYGYIEDRYGNRFYYPGSRMRFLFDILF